MPKLVGQYLFAPRGWLAMGAICFGGALAMGYHEEQMSAEQVLRAKVGQPEEVLIQNFAPDLHMNLLRQVQVLGETVDSNSQEIDIGTSDNPHRVVAVPIYPVGSQFAPIVAQRRNDASGQIRRPMPRSEAPKIAQANEGLDSFGQNAFAFALVEKAPAAAAIDQNRGKIEVLATLDGRALVRLTGALVSGSAFSKMISDAMSKNGVSSSPETLIVEPAPLPVAAAVSQEWASWSRGWLTVLGILFIFVALVMPVLRNNRIVAFSRNAEPQDVKAAHSFPAVSFFQPIATQDELAKEEADERMLGSPRLLGVKMATTNFLNSIASGVRFRSPQ